MVNGRDQVREYKAGAGATARLFALDDGMGNITSVTDANGMAAERYLYTPDGKMEFKNGSWGDTANRQSELNWRYTFHGTRRDGEGLYNTGGGEWDYLTGGRLSQDPVAYADREYNAFRANIANAEVPDEVADPHHAAMMLRWGGIILTGGFGGWAGIGFSALGTFRNYLKTPFSADSHP